MPKVTTRGKKTTNNYRAQPRKSVGAPKGNRNALRHGRRSAAYLAKRREIRARLRELKALSAGFKALGVEAELQADLALRIVALQALARAPLPP